MCRHIPKIPPAFTSFASQSATCGGATLTGTRLPPVSSLHSNCYSTLCGCHLMPGSCKQCPTLRWATTVGPSRSQGQTVSPKSILMYFEGLLSLGLVSLELARLLAPCKKLGPTSQWPSIRFAHPWLDSWRWCSLEIKLGQIECRNKQCTSMYSSFFLTIKGAVLAAIHQFTDIYSMSEKSI